MEELTCRPHQIRKFRGSCYYEIIDKELLVRNTDKPIFCMMYIEAGESEPTGDSGLTHAEAIRMRDQYKKDPQDDVFLDEICVNDYNLNIEDD